MKRRNFIQNLLGAAVAGPAAVKEVLKDERKHYKPPKPLSPKKKLSGGGNESGYMMMDVGGKNYRLAVFDEP